MKKKVDFLMDQLDHDPKAEGAGGAGQYNSGTETESDQDEDDVIDDENIKAT